MELTEEQKLKIESEEKYRSQLRKDISTTQKHGVPAILSFFVPGLGQLVKGQIGRGVLIFFLTLFGFALFAIPGLIIHIWQIVDAYNK